MSTRFNLARAALPLVGGVLLILGEYVWGATPVRLYLSWLGALVLGAAVAWSLRWALQSSTGPSGTDLLAATQGLGRLTLALPPALLAVAAGVYGLGLLLPDSDGFDRLALVGWGWAFTALFGVVLLGFVEAAWISQVGAPHADGLRLRLARQAGTSLGLLLLLIVTLNFVFDRLHWSWDWGYFRIAEAGDATRETIRNLNAPVEVGVFFPQGNGVDALLRDYFHPLEAISPYFTVSFYDAELQPDAAVDFRVGKNGTVVVRREGQDRDLSLALDVDSARDQLSSFDADFLKQVALVARPKRTIYFTVGHGERNEQSTVSPNTIKGFEALVRAQNFTIKSLGLSEGLGTEVPVDAAVVVVVGPRRPFLPAEEDALVRYLDDGGRMLVFLEPIADRGAAGVAPASGAETRTNTPLSTLLVRYGVRYEAVVQANDRIFGRRTRTKADHVLLATASYGAHPALASLQRNANQFPLLLLESGAWVLNPETEVLAEALPLMQTVNAMPETWGDINRNFIFDDDIEYRATPPLAIAIGPLYDPPPDLPHGVSSSPDSITDVDTGNGDNENEANKGDATTHAATEGEPARPLETRIVAFADADVASDLFIQNRANHLVLLDALAWLVGDAAPAAESNDTQDLKIHHLKGDEVLWFQLPVFAVPLLTLGVGFWIVRHGRKAGSGTWGEGSGQDG